MKIIIIAGVFALVACTSPVDDAASPQSKPAEPASVEQGAVQPAPVDSGEAAPAKPASSGPCDAAIGQYAVGKKFSDALAATLKKETGAANVRVIPPGTMVTMDFRDDRLNVTYDDKDIITKVSCG